MQNGKKLKNELNATSFFTIAKNSSFIPKDKPDSHRRKRRRPSFCTTCGKYTCHMGLLASWLNLTCFS
jgi:hypothetical protein